MGFESQEKVPRMQVESSDFSPETMHVLKEDLLRIERECFDEKSFSEEDFQEIAELPDAVIATLKKGSLVIGYSLGGADEQDEESFSIFSTAITPNEQGKGHVGPLIAAIENEARKRGYLFLTRHAAIDNGYADKIQKHYGDKAIETSERDSPWGHQRYFRIKL